MEATGFPDQPEQHARLCLLQPLKDRRLTAASPSDKKAVWIPARRDGSINRGLVERGFEQWIGFCLFPSKIESSG
jgi:hypothetical protein